MLYKHGKGAAVYRNSGVKNFGCISSIIAFPFNLIFWIFNKLAGIILRQK